MSRHVMGYVIAISNKIATIETVDGIVKRLYAYKDASAGDIVRIFPTEAKYSKSFHLQEAQVRKIFARVLGPSFGEKVHATPSGSYGPHDMTE